MRNRRLPLPISAFAGLLALLGNAAPLAAAPVSPGDPDPGEGIGYHWTAEMGGDESASLEGSVGAWSWDDGGSAAPSGQGWTHTSDWVALRLREACRLTVRLARRDAGTGTGHELCPAFTIYRGWQRSGGDSHAYANRGDISWAPDTLHLAHFAGAPENATVEGTIRLPAGDYSIVLGGNSPAAGSPTAPQDFAATLRTRPPYDPAAVTVDGARQIAKGSRHVLRGRIVNRENLAAVRVRLRGRETRALVSGNRWRAPLAGLREGANRARIITLSRDGSRTRPLVVTIRRIGEPSANRPLPRPRFGWIPAPARVRTSS